MLVYATMRHQTRCMPPHACIHGTICHKMQPCATICYTMCHSTKHISRRHLCRHNFVYIGARARRHCPGQGVTMATRSRKSSARPTAFLPETPRRARGKREGFIRAQTTFKFLRADDIRVLRADDTEFYGRRHSSFTRRRRVMVGVYGGVRGEYGRLSRSKIAVDGPIVSSWGEA